jgi:hypothetical protein
MEKNPKKKRRQHESNTPQRTKTHHDSIRRNEHRYTIEIKQIHIPGFYKTKTTIRQKSK